MDSYLQTDGHLLGRLISIGYPVMDVCLLAVAARLVAAAQLRQPTFILMSGGLVSLIIADVIYGILARPRRSRPVGSPTRSGSASTD